MRFFFIVESDGEELDFGIDDPGSDQDGDYKPSAHVKAEPILGEATIKPELPLFEETPKLDSGKL